MAQERSTKIISTIKWIRTSRLSIKKSLSEAGSDSEEEEGGSESLPRRSLSGSGDDGVEAAAREAAPSSSGWGLPGVLREEGLHGRDGLAHRVGRDRAVVVSSCQVLPRLAPLSSEEEGGSESDIDDDLRAELRVAHPTP